MRPFIVWTLRRTGGTTLSSILEQHSLLPTIEHEPFLPGRVFGNVARAHEAKNRTGFRDGLKQIMADRYPLKHCIDTHPLEFSIDLAKILGDEYGHVILLRRNESLRLLSLAMAEATGAWRYDSKNEVQRQIRLPIRKFRREYGRCRSLVKALSDVLSDRPTTAYFEDLYEGSMSARLEALNRVAQFLKLDSIAEDSDLAARLVEREQSKAARAYLSNEQEFLAKVTRPGLVDRIREFLRAGSST
jgi:hypothetical protein